VPPFGFKKFYFCKYIIYDILKINFFQMCNNSRVNQYGSRVYNFRQAIDTWDEKQRGQVPNFVGNPDLQCPVLKNYFERDFNSALLFR
jgi:hypothetical protein